MPAPAIAIRVALQKLLSSGAKKVMKPKTALGESVRNSAAGSVPVTAVATGANKITAAQRKKKKNKIVEELSK